MIEPTEGDILTVLNRYLDNGDRDTFHQILIGRAIAEIKHLRMRVADLKNGFEGSCTACEPVGEMNRKLNQELSKIRAEKALNEMTRLDEEMGLLFPEEDVDPGF